LLLLAEQAAILMDDSNKPRKEGMFETESETNERPEVR